MKLFDKVRVVEGPHAGGVGKIAALGHGGNYAMVDLQPGTLQWIRTAELEVLIEPLNDSPLQCQVGGDHYRKLAIQPVEFCQRNQLGYCESAVIKYVTRHREKNGVEDINKAIHYLQLLKEIEYPETTEKP